jgi:hypothetical protein
VGGGRSDPIPFKYQDSAKIHHLYSNENICLIVAGIRFYKVSNGTVTSAGFAIKN